MAKRREAGRQRKQKTATRLSGHLSLGGLWVCDCGASQVAECLADISSGQQAQCSNLLSRDPRRKTSPGEQRALMSLASGVPAGILVKTII